MPNPYFQFKQFTVWHDKCGMKVGTDGVLLGAWAPIENAHRLLDIGTGTGLVALMLAQRSLSDSNIVALEVDKAAYEQAQENVAHSPWSQRIEVCHGDFRQFCAEEKFDVIVSNPPYFVNSLLSPNEQRAMARHTGLLTYEELLYGVTRLLTNEGRFTVIVPTVVSHSMKEVARKYGLYPVKQLDIQTKPGGVPKRTLICFSFREHFLQIETMLIEFARHQYSPEYIELTKDFYLHM